jgi:hypothetical protein
LYVPESRRYELRVGAEVVAIAEYIPVVPRGRIVLAHTEVDPPREGEGLASLLARGVLDDIRGRGLLVEPLCPFWLPTSSAIPSTPNRGSRDAGTIRRCLRFGGPTSKASPTTARTSRCASTRSAACTQPNACGAYRRCSIPSAGRGSSLTADAREVAEVVRHCPSDALHDGERDAPLGTRRTHRSATTPAIACSGVGGRAKSGCWRAQSGFPARGDAAHDGHGSIEGTP